MTGRAAPAWPGFSMQETKLHRYADLGIEAFILSGYPHATECDLFARHVPPHLDHGSLPRQA